MRGPPMDQQKLDSFFRKYRDQSEDAIREEGIESFCSDLNISTLDPLILVVACYCRAEHMGTFTREEFCSGMSRLGCDDIHKLKAQLGQLREVLQNKQTLKEVYTYTFQFALDPGQRCLPVEICIEFWKMLLKDHFALLNDWIAFVENNVKNSVSKDTWVMLYDLATQVRPDLSDYDTNGAWPVLLDEFVEHMTTGGK